MEVSVICNKHNWELLEGVVECSVCQMKFKDFLSPGSVGSSLPADQRELGCLVRTFVEPIDDEHCDAFWYNPADVIAELEKDCRKAKIVVEGTPTIEGPEGDILFNRIGGDGLPFENDVEIGDSSYGGQINKDCQFNIRIFYDDSWHRSTRREVAYGNAITSASKVVENDVLWREEVRKIKEIEALDERSEDGQGS